MNHHGKWFAYGAGVAGIALGVACATDAYTALQIKQVQVLTAPDCTVPGTATTVFRDHGVLDLALPDGSTPPYYLPVLVVNNLGSVGGTSPAEEMNNITLSHFTVELSAPGVTWNSTCPAKFDTQTITDTIPPGGSVGASMNIIQTTHSQCLRSQLTQQGLVVTAKITAKGRHGGTSIESAPFIFSVDVCAGCEQAGYTNSTLALYQYPADVPLCSEFAAGSTNPATGDPCLPRGQDAPIFCCSITQTVAGVPTEVALCPGAFPAATSTATSTTTSTTTSTSISP
jgi:hypothetical protein